MMKKQVTVYSHSAQLLVFSACLAYAIYCIQLDIF